MYACVCVCAHMYIHACQGVIMENKGPVVRRETVGFEVRWKMLFCLAEQTQWSHSASPLYCLLSSRHQPSTHTQNRIRDLVEKDGWDELLLNLRAAGGEVQRRLEGGGGETALDGGRCFPSETWRRHLSRRNHVLKAPFFSPVCTNRTSWGLIMWGDDSVMCYVVINDLEQV